MLAWFLLCSNLSQKSINFNFNLSLLQKEKDLELAARIGQTLLEQNKSLVDKCEQLELDLISYQEQVDSLYYFIHYMNRSTA